MYCGEFYNAPGGNQAVRIISQPVTSPDCDVVIQTYAEVSAVDLGDALAPIAVSEFVQVAGGSAGLLLLAFLVSYFVGVMVRTVD